MQELVSFKGESLITNSRTVADVFGKAHRNVIIDIEKLQCSQEFREQNYLLSYYTSPQNKKLKCYEITRDGFCFLCMGFTGQKASQWKEAYIKAFNEMEKGLLNIDSQMNKLCKDGEKLKLLGSEWSKFGHDIKKEKQRHKQQVGALVDKVQRKLEFK